MKSPLKAKPLRNSGDSTTQMIWDVLLDDVVIYLFMAIFSITIALLEWGHWYFITPPNPLACSMVAVFAIILAVYKIKVGMQKIKHLQLGRDGEKAVGQYLERLRENGAQVFHDILGEGFNIDHVVIHQSGIYTIETKTFSKPDRGESRIIFNGENVVIFGRQPDRNPVIQARAASSWLKELLFNSTGKSIVVRPVVLFPGWFIEPTAEARSSEVWVLNPKALPSFIENSKQQIADTDVHLFASHLSRYIRSV